MPSEERDRRERAWEAFEGPTVAPTIGNFRAFIDSPCLDP